MVGKEKNAAIFQQRLCKYQWYLKINDKNFHNFLGKNLIMGNNWWFEW